MPGCMMATSWALMGLFSAAAQTGRCDVRRWKLPCPQCCRWHAVVLSRVHGLSKTCQHGVSSKQGMGQGKVIQC